jgi:hypothetical protein
LLSVIDECLSEAEPHRKHAATLAAVATALSEQQNDTNQGYFERVGLCGLSHRHFASNQKRTADRLALPPRSD